MLDIENVWVKRLGTATLPLSSNQQGWSIASKEDPAFVEPTLKVLAGDPATARIFVVAAPGAVGKSTYARAVCARTQTVLVDLAATDPLGGNFFVGGIANAFGYEALADVANGSMGLIVDALDEAQLRSGSEGFAAGLLDLCKIVEKSSALPATLFGRAAAADEAWIILKDAGLEPCLLQIDYFNDEQSTHFLTRRLPVLASARSAAMKSAFDKHEAKFIELAQATRQKLVSTPGGEEQRFAGYAPVLDAICAYALEEDEFNPAARLADLAAEGPITLIIQIAESILDREQAKLTSQIENIPADLDPLKLYSRNEQLGRVAIALFGANAPSTTTINDLNFREIYEGMVASFAPQHPFLDQRGNPSNAAFAAYVLVWAIKTGAAKTEARRALSINPALGSGLFFEIYMSQTKSPPENHRIELDDLGPLYASFASQASQGEYPTLDVSGETGDSSVDIDFEMVRGGGGEQDGRRYGPYTSAIDGIIEFRGPVGGLSISAPVSVVLGDGRTASITSPVDIDVEELEIDARELRVFRSSANEDQNAGLVSLAATEASLNRVERIYLHGARLEVIAPSGRVHPWADYVVDRPAAPNEKIASLRRRARKILTSFRSHSKGALVRYAAKIESSRMMKEGAEGPALLARLKKDNILTTFDSGKFYQLHPEILAKHFNMDYQALHLQRWTAEADDYLTSAT